MKDAVESPKAIERLADGILLGLGAAFVSVLIFLVSAYGMVAHYAFPGVVALGLFAARWLRAPLKINLTLAVLPSLMSLYAGELVLAVVTSHRENFEVARWLFFPSDSTRESAQARLEEDSTKTPTFDRRDKLQVIEDFTRDGVSAHPAVVPQNLLTWDSASQNLRALFIDDVETLPLGGLSKALTVFCNESGEYITYKSDQYGFHNPPGVWKHQQLEIAAVGDSFTHGACVPSGDTFVGVIRAQHPATANLGMDSNGPLMMLASLKEYAQAFRPKIVLWFYYEGNDLRDLEYERLSPLLRRYLTRARGQHLLDRQGEIDQALMDFIDKARQNVKRKRVGLEETITLYHVRQALALLYRGGYKQVDADRLRLFRTYLADPVTEETINHFRSVLVEATSTVRGWGGHLYFVYLPEYDRYAQPELADKNRDRVLRLVTDLKLPVIDLHQSFDRLPDPVGLFPFRRLNHYNVEGHRLVGKEVLRVLAGTDVAVQLKPTGQ